MKGNVTNTVLSEAAQGVRVRGLRAYSWHKSGRKMLLQIYANSHRSKLWHCRQGEVYQDCSLHRRPHGHFQDG